MATFQLGGDPPPEVLDYFRSKSLRPAYSWLDVWGQEHAHAFTVAKATELDVLTSFRGALDRAMSKGVAFEDFRKDITGELAKLGWDRPRLVTDAGSGESKEVDFTAPRRLKTIFHSNVRAARAAGQWERAQRTKRMLPYFLYVRTTASDPRQEHLQWAGTILPVDDPFWRTHFPPNGWGCKCAVRQVSRMEADRNGGISSPPKVTSQPFRNRRTGEKTQIPDGIDPGWHTNPGLSRAETLTRRTADAIAEAGPEAGRAVVEKLWQSNYPDMTTKLPQRVHVPVAVSPRLAGEIGAAGALLTISSDTLRTKSERTGRRMEDFAAIQELLDRGESLPDPAHRVGRVVFGKIGRQFMRLAIGLSRDERFMYVRTLHPLGTEPARMLALMEEARRRAEEKE